MLFSCRRHIPRHTQNHQCACHASNRVHKDVMHPKSTTQVLEIDAWPSPHKWHIDGESPIATNDAYADLNALGIDARTRAPSQRGSYVLL